MVCSHLLRCRLLGLLLLLCWGSSLWAQDYYRAEEPSRCDSSVYTDRLGIRLLGQGFFRNNEYATELADDYTLPGYRLRLDVGYSPDTRLPVQLRLGVANLYYWGASRYPAALAYQDLPYWRGDGERYTKLRLLPFFQATILPTPRLALILGNLEGGVKHDLIDPLYNPELNLTADEERGFQLKYAGKRTEVDTWVDWQSFIFKGEKHPEAFVFGLHLRRALWDHSASRLDVDLQAVAQHRGGVLNQRADTVHTWMNAALGLRYTHRFALGAYPLIWTTSAFALGYSQRGEHFPVSHGTGLYAQSQLAWRRWQLRLGFWSGTDYISPLGVPFAQSLKVDKRQPGGRLYTHYPSYWSLQASYRLVERVAYTFGASAGLWVHPHGKTALSTFAEVYLSVSPYFRLLSK